MDTQRGPQVDAVPPQGLRGVPPQGSAQQGYYDPGAMPPPGDLWAQQHQHFQGDPYYGTAPSFTAPHPPNAQADRMRTVARRMLEDPSRDPSLASWAPTSSRQSRTTADTVTHTTVAGDTAATAMAMALVESDRSGRSSVGSRACISKGGLQGTWTGRM